MIDSALQNSESPWYERAWVFQEFMVAQQITIRYGRVCKRYDNEWINCLHRGTQPGQAFSNFADKTRRWNRLRAAMSYRGPASTLFTSPEKYETLASYHPQEPLGIFNVFMNRGVVSATDQRDHVYSVVALIHQDEARLQPPDYNLSSAEVYAIATYASIRERHNLDVLGSIDHSDEPTIAALPSWSVNWACPRLIRRIMLATWSIGAFDQFDNRDHLHARRCALSELQPPSVLPSLSADLLYLTIPGTPVDDVSDVFLAWSSDDDELHDLKAFMSMLFQFVCAIAARVYATTLESGSGKNLASIMLRSSARGASCAMISGDDFHQALPRDFAANTLIKVKRRLVVMAAFHLWTVKNSYYAPEGAPLSIDWPHQQTLDLEYPGNVSIFSTSSGLIGVTNDEVQKGDSIVLVRSHNPFIILSPDGERFRYSGRAWLHEHMNEENLLF